MRFRLTKDSVRRLAPSRSRDRIAVYDTDLPGFGVMAYRSGKKMFFLEYGEERRRRRKRLGTFGVLTVDKARSLALIDRAKWEQKIDPRSEQIARKKAVTWSDWAADYLDGIRKRKKVWSADARYLQEASRRWGGRLLAEITPEDVERIFRGHADAGHKIQANRWLASIRACLAHAWRAGLIDDNPAARIRPYRENSPRTRVLTEDELGRILTAVREWPDAYTQAAYVLLIGTGARVSEVLHARWAEIDIENATWRLSETKAGKAQVIPLSGPVLECLRELQGLNNESPYVVPGLRHDAPRHDLKRSWQFIRDRAGLVGANLHDIRRTYGLQIAREAGILVASRLLRHGDSRITDRVYAPLQVQADLRPVADRNGQRLQAMLDRVEAADAALREKV